MLEVLAYTRGNQLTKHPGFTPTNQQYSNAEYCTTFYVSASSIYVIAKEEGVEL